MGLAEKDVDPLAPQENYIHPLPTPIGVITQMDVAEANKWFGELGRKDSQFTPLHLAIVLANHRATERTQDPITDINRLQEEFRLRRGSPDYHRGYEEAFGAVLALL
jgi:hypothetical protein